MEYTFSSKWVKLRVLRIIYESWRAAADTNRHRTRLLNRKERIQQFKRHGIHILIQVGQTPGYAHDG
jgi:hypothetical protein